MSLFSLIIFIFQNCDINNLIWEQGVEGASKSLIKKTPDLEIEIHDMLQQWQFIEITTAICPNYHRKSSKLPSKFVEITIEIRRNFHRNLSKLPSKLPTEIASKVQISFGR